MDAFKISRSQGDATLTPALRGIVYLRVLAGWQHPSGAWLVIAETPGFPSHMSVHWRACAHYGTDALEFADAFDDLDRDAGWARALKSAEIAYAQGPGPGVLAKAELVKDNMTRRGKAAGNASVDARAKLLEEKSVALEVAKRWKVHYMPQYDAKRWLFDPTGFPGQAVINFTWKKLAGTCAFIAPEEDGIGWRVGRGWYPRMNDEAPRIEEDIVRHYGSNPFKTDPAIQLLEALLRTDPEKWLRGDYTAFWDGKMRRAPDGWEEG